MQGAAADTQMAMYPALPALCRQLGGMQSVNLITFNAVQRMTAGCQVLPTSYSLNGTTMQRAHTIQNGL